MRRKLLEWTGHENDVTVGNMYTHYYDSDLYGTWFVDDKGNRRPVSVGAWEDVEVPSPPSPLLEACASLGKFLEAKNQKYGNSVNEPIQVFGPQMSPEAAFYVRMNDKISRITNGPEEPRENDLVDLAGYIMLLLARRGCVDYSYMID